MALAAYVEVTGADWHSFFTQFSLEDSLTSNDTLIESKWADRIPSCATT